MSKSLKIILAGLAGATIMATAASASGFNRGTADTDILYEDGNFVSRSSMTFVSPTVDVSYVGLTGASTGEIAEAYVVPNFAMKLQATDSVSCAGTYTTPFGAGSDYTGTTAGFDNDALATTEQTFVTNEFGLTCAYGMDVGKGRFSILGGGFIQTLDYEQLVGAGAFRFELSDTGYGYRVGAAYEIPEIALRAQLMYRSEVTVDATGTFGTIGGFVTNPGAFGRATFPQSVELKVQSGVAPGWLVYGGVKWTDWSVFDVLTYQASTPGLDQTLNFFWKDGWTVNAGVAHQFTDKIAGTVGVTWDSAVGTGHDLRDADVWTISAGGSYKPNDMVEFRGGLGVSFIGAATQTFTSDAIGNPIAAPAGFKSAEAGHAIGGTISAKIKF